MSLFFLKILTRNKIKTTNTTKMKFGDVAINFTEAACIGGTAALMAFTGIDGMIARTLTGMVGGVFQQYPRLSDAIVVGGTMMAIELAFEFVIKPNLPDNWKSIPPNA